jgi:hypothetical protein
MKHRKISAQGVYAGFAPAIPAAASRRPPLGAKLKAAAIVAAAEAAAAERAGSPSNSEMIEARG